MEKVAASLILDAVERGGHLHSGQFGNRPRRSAIDAVAVLIHRAATAAATMVYRRDPHPDRVSCRIRRSKDTGVLLMDVKSAYPSVDKAHLLARMEQLRLPPDLVAWTGSFTSGRSVCLVIDQQEGPPHEVETGVPQGSPVSPILFAIYISDLFTYVCDRVPGARALSFVDDVSLAVEDDRLEDIVSKLSECARHAVEWADEHAVTFDTEK